MSYLWNPIQSQIAAFLDRMPFRNGIASFKSFCPICMVFYISRGCFCKRFQIVIARKSVQVNFVLRIWIINFHMPIHMLSDSTKILSYCSRNIKEALSKNLRKVVFLT